ncbi:MAG: 2-C-methyl-D-erythritol 2,4-cyclodiphosphate synthase [Oscillospiraceae bacterium]|jgi:2-C-methyl-D-erythritol 2,4-cyclodiphosphate synthase/2-C-methyl-D-erythritol 4-phosphate cytidylyltransferase|nr:2-C-methyl-D-erythritol 2,4-cyclodiphosphate synthase [Oscillospiraceae bacterium]
MTYKKKAAAIIAASGRSSRMNGINKLFADLNGIPVIMRTVLAFEKAESIDEIIIVTHPESAQKIQDLCLRFNITKPLIVTEGARHRQESIFCALKVNSSDIIAIHDGARPLITSENINQIITLAYEKDAVIPAVRVKETVKVVQDGRIIGTPDRGGLYLAQTPQAFCFEKYKKAMEKARGLSFTDDAQLFENAGFEVFVTEGDYNNIKITTPEDLEIARAFIGANNIYSLKTRIGSGYDVHKFGKDRKLILCGIEIPHEEGLLGHSDADVAVHALMDALLGALALGDIGRHFPDTSPEFKGISSMELLRRVMALINEKGYAPSNIDITIIADRPRLAPFITQMRENIAAVCNIPLEAVSVKATSEEGLGLAGKGIGANAVCLLENIIFT